MAIIKKPVPVQATRPVQKQPVRQAARPATDGFVIVSENEIEFATRGGGRGASPEVEALKNKLRGLRIGQGLKLPSNMVVSKLLGNSTIYTYKGANSVRNMAKNEGAAFQTRRDTQNNIYIFRITPKDEEVTEVQE